jgi:hypothetical protein
MVSDESKSPSLRKARLNLLLRQREGEAERVRLKRLLVNIPSDEWRLLPLPVSDVASENLFSAVRSARESGRLIAKVALSGSEFEDEFRRVLADWPDSDPVLVALSNVSQIGLLEISLGAVHSIIHELVDFDRDSMIAASKDMSHGAIAQRFEHGQDVSYEIESWVS